VRLFEAAACGVPVISDRWDGLAELLPEVLVADGPLDVLRLLDGAPDGTALRERVLAEHTAARRVAQLEQLVGAAVAP
jgi:spore maturation protein CgeB